MANNLTLFNLNYLNVSLKIVWFNQTFSTGNKNIYIANHFIFMDMFENKCGFNVFRCLCVQAKKNSFEFSSIKHYIIIYTYNIQYTL